MNVFPSLFFSLFQYLISGFKWFSSAADGQVALALARTNPDLSLGSRGLSAFIIPIHKKNRPSLPPSVEARVKETDERKGHTHSPYNGIYIHRLKVRRRSSTLVSEVGGFGSPSLIHTFFSFSLLSHSRTSLVPRWCLQQSLNWMKQSEN